MARGVNKVILIGNLGADPETRYTSNQRAVTNLRIATTRSWLDKQSNDLHEETEGHRVVFFGRQAEVANEYLRKGSQAYVEGRIQTRKWQDQSGQDRYTTEIIGEDLQFLGGRGGGGGGGGSSTSMPESQGGGQQGGGQQGGGQQGGGNQPQSGAIDSLWA